MTSPDVEIPPAAYGVAFPLAVVAGYVDAVAFRRARLHRGVWTSFLAGGVLGAFLALHWDLWSLTLPLAVLAVLIVVDVARRA